jgi:energy-coupling factor transporter ATP-binding protein EcfA2
MSFPGSKWWRFDFHAHTPASDDYGKGPDQDTLKARSPRQWLLDYMGAEIDCVAVTDHNSGAWIDSLKTELLKMQEDKPAGYRPITLFPGVELSIAGGWHLLAIFDPSASSATINDLLSKAGYGGTRGKCDGVTDKAGPAVVNLIHELDGLAIPAHCDDSNGLLREVSGETLRPVLQNTHVLAFELCDASYTTPAMYTEEKVVWAEVIGSDAHHPEGTEEQQHPGSHFTWVKMGTPSLEGLRLSLIDGNGVSIHRSDAVPTDFTPNSEPAEMIESINVTKAKVMGRDGSDPAQFTLSPWMNAIVGGRGSGKSTVVHCLRIALNRADELDAIGGEPLRSFDRFYRIAAGRDDDGALMGETRIEVVWRKEGSRFRISRGSDSTPPRVEHETADGNWELADSQSVRLRFPLRIFSQGQIGAMADGRSKALLDVVDNAIGAADWNAKMDVLRNEYLSMCAKHRQLLGQLEERDRLMGELSDVTRKLKKFEDAEHAQTLKAYQRIHKQRQEVEGVLRDAGQLEARATETATKLTTPRIADGVFDTADAVDKTALEQLETLYAAVGEERKVLEDAGKRLKAACATCDAAIKKSDWWSRVEQVEASYVALVQELQEQGVADPSEYGQLVQKRQGLEKELALLKQIQEKSEAEATAIAAKLKEVESWRLKITQDRTNFLADTLRQNAFVRIEIDGFGRIAREIEQSFRSLIGAEDDRFAGDILDEESSSGLVAELIQNLSTDAEDARTEVLSRLATLKEKLRLASLGDNSQGFGQRFNSFLQRSYERDPAILDQITLWFPDDSLRVFYSPAGDGAQWQSISQGSAGQRTAALLAFFMAYGHEPIVFDQPEDDLDNHLIYSLVVRQIRDNKTARQLIVVTHNPNIVVNGDAEMVHAMGFRSGQCRIIQKGCLQDGDVREEVCTVMEGGREAFELRYKRLGRMGRNI